MSTQIIRFINHVLTEMTLDNRVDDGIVDFSKEIHREIFAEHLVRYDIDPSCIQEAVNKLVTIQDGKYPDRQAFNKEGWLVTFPTPEHRNAAIKKKTHFVSDPTNGRGGMNLYYKKKGQQKRQTTQGSTEVEPDQTENPPVQVDQSDSASSALPGSEVDGSSDQKVAHQDPSNGGSSPKTSLPQSQQSTSSPTDGATDAQPQQAAPIDSAVPTTNDAETQSNSTPTNTPDQQQTSSNADLVSITVEFAKTKSWTTTPYGEWNDPKGQLVAVTGLDGQVVPTKFTDREELRSQVEKRGITLPVKTG